MFRPFTKVVASVMAVAIFSLSGGVMALAVDDENISTENTYSSNLDSDENYYFSGSEFSSEVVNVLPHGNNPISVEDVISNSTNIQRNGATDSGDFTSKKFSAGILGYKYTISFSWVAKVVNGDYVFDYISNAKITTYTNYLILAVTWELYSYRITKNTYYFTGDRKSVIFETNYAFDVRDKTTHNDMTLYQNNKQTFSLQSIR